MIKVRSDVNYRITQVNHDSVNYYGLHFNKTKVPCTLYSLYNQVTIKF